jgi:dTDP-L-rhamnose 4-epimerase
MRVLITGGAGFIGSGVSQALMARNHEVAIFDNLSPTVHGNQAIEPGWAKNDCQFILGDVRNESSWGNALRTNPDVVVHLAAETGVGQSMYDCTTHTDVNVGGTTRMLDAIRAHKNGIEHIVLASSRAVYGEGSYLCEQCGVVTPEHRSGDQLKAGYWDPNCPICDGATAVVATDEHAQARPSSVYGLSKFMQEGLIGIVGPSLGLSSTILRYSNVYGEGQPLTNPYTGVLAAFALRAVLGTPPAVYEDGLESRDFVHVEDVVRATVMATEGRHSTVINIGSGERNSLLDVARLICIELGAVNLVPEVNGLFRVGDIRHFVADVSRAKDQLDFVATIDLQAGLHRFAAWVKSEALIPDTDVAKRAESELRRHGLVGQTP